MKITYEVLFSSTSDGFTNSRSALKKLLEIQGTPVLDIKTDLELENYQYLKHYPPFITSLTHTKGAGASVLALKKDYFSLGIDIEWSDRPVKKEAQRFFRHPEDSMQTDNILLWTRKEAAFKALSRIPHKSVLVLSKIIIQDDKFWSQENPAIKGTITTNTQNHEGRDLFISWAYILNSTF